MEEGAGKRFSECDFHDDLDTATAAARATPPYPTCLQSDVVVFTNAVIPWGSTFSVAASLPQLHIPVLAVSISAR